MVHGRDPVLHDVGGGRQNWKPGVNFSDWSTHQHFYIGDWLYFGFDKNLYSVLEVNKSNQESCNEADFITNITKGGRDVFELKEARPYYFISGRGFCFQGMKLSVNVENTPPALPPSPGGSSFPPKFFGHSHLPMLVASVFWLFVG
ncbi:Plastocyanin-like protein [Corchorus olitorius]|uniref:Plastocyanin-like protein n=1 Tax=Corchorus olitorius TaxID=93759 RepID=A0A1R3J9H3_9ROSI|nr:Plastocyanin-like protein [Corchorus olitorius]